MKDCPLLGCSVIQLYMKGAGNKMQLDDRSYQLFQELMENPSVYSKDLEESYDLTRRQLGYSFGKINEWLREKNLPAIERTRQGHFIVDASILTNLGSDLQNSKQDLVIMPESQRVYMIILMLLGSEEELSLNHFTIELDVSKNTVLNDMKQVRKIAAEYDLEIRYSRIKGYVVDGEEFEIRKLLLRAMENILEMPNGESRMRQVLDMDEAHLIDLKSRVERVENKLHLKFTDEKILMMPYTLLLVLERIRRGNIIKKFLIEYVELSGTKEYQATEEILFDIEDIPVQERLFITLHLLTTNVYWAGMLTEEEIPNLKQALDEMLRLFETSACVFLQDRQQLLDKLLLHVTPAYYRIKYHLTDVWESQHLISRDYKELHHLVAQSTTPLAQLIGNEIPDNETAFLTMLIGGWLRKQGDSIEEKVKAIVVCPKGVSVSRLMLSELKELFPEFIFLDSLSIRQFQDYKLDYDIVFSPTFLDTDKKLFLASAFLGDEEKRRLRKQVMMELNGFVSSDVHVEDLLSIIKKHATVNNEHQLVKDLQQYIQPVDAAAIHQQSKPESMNLSELLTPDKMTLVDSAPSWDAAIEMSAAPLVHSEQVLPAYVKAVIDHCKSDPYIVIGENIAIPHAAPEEGVHRVGMSLLRLKEGVRFTTDHLINLVIVIAAVDKEQHLKALLQLMKLAQSDEDRQTLIRARTAQEIHSVLQTYATE